MSVVLSKLAPSVSEFGRKALRPTQIILCPVRSGGHGHIYVKRPGQLYWNRLKDAAHFYWIGIGILPTFIVIMAVHIIFGPCQLTDYPKDGPPPRYWQYERTPLRQWYQKYFGTSEMEYHERNMALLERNNIRHRWRRLELRVWHLQGQRWDYKGYFHEPISSNWIDYSRKRHEQMHWQYEPHGTQSF